MYKLISTTHRDGAAARIRAGNNAGNVKKARLGWVSLTVPAMMGTLYKNKSILKRRAERIRNLVRIGLF